MSTATLTRKAKQFAVPGHRCEHCGSAFDSTDDLAAHRGCTTNPSGCLSPSTMFSIGWRRTAGAAWSKPPVKRKRTAIDPWQWRCHLCGKYFADETAFDTHHHMVMPVLSRCLDFAELKALNFSLTRGVWVTTQMSLSSEFRVFGLPSVRTDLRANGMGGDAIPVNLTLDPTDAPPGTDECRCSACQEYFPSTEAFDGHLQGCSDQAS
jgi:Zinc-finger of C2H2 type